MTVDEILTELEILLKNHNWYYEFNDDIGVWRKENQTNLRIHSLLKLLESMGNKKIGTKLYDKYCPWGLNKDC
jgi:hypothetical protein